MRKLNRKPSKILFSGLLILLVLLVGSCESWMSNDNFMEQIESEVHDANASQVSVYVRNASTKMGSTEPSGNVTMKVDVASKISTIPSEDYGFFKWAAFSTNDFPTNKQHNNLTFISEKDYNENYKSKELPSSIVHFANPKSATTEVKILSSRSDIFIVPIVTERPKYVQSIPASGDNKVVLNTSIRILFSKPIDENTLHDEEGLLNYSITTSSSSGGMGEDDPDLDVRDITDLFDYKLNSSGKMLSLTLKENIDDNGEKVKELLDPRQTISVNLLEGICDRYGYAMKGNFQFNFKTGTETDSIAPYIEVLVGGTGDICDVFVSFHNEEWNGKATEAAKKAPKDINSSEYDDKLLAQRVYDKINLYVKAEDIIGTEDTDVDVGTNTEEDNVNYVVIEASLMVDSDGKPVTVDTSVPKKNIMYIPGTLDSKSGINKLFSEIVPLGEKGQRRKDGTIFSYDVSSLPDGLIKINVWAIDMTGNSGGPNDSGAPNIAKHDNGYKSIFVVKDTTPIDSAEVKKNKKVISNSERAPYFWYNKESLKTMELFDSLENKIQDKGHAKLRSLDKNLWWTFRVGDTSEKVLANDSSWQRIHDEETGNTSLHYSLNNAEAPSKDGPIDITLYLKDDLGNLSEPVLLDSIMYDNTAPTVSLKAGIGDFVNAKGEAVLHASDDQVISQILKVDIGETNNDEAGSGIRRMEIHVTKDGIDVAEPLDATKFAVKYAPASIENPKPTSEGIRDIAIDADDVASTANIKVFKVKDSDKITSGTLFIYGIKLGDADGTYQISIDLYDSALNKTPETDIKLHRGATTNFARDTTDPVINKVQIAGAVSRVAYGESVASWWMPITEQNPASLEKVSFAVDVSETGSGIQYIKLGKNIEFTSATKIRYGSTYLEENKDYILDLANHTIELKDWFNAILKNEKAKAITLENVKLNNPDSTTGNEIAITADDFVKKSSGAKTEFFYNETTSGSVIYADTQKPEITNLVIEDAAEETDNNPHSLGYNKTYTDNQNVTLILTPKAESASFGSGVKTIHLSDNALFTDSTVIKVDGVELTEGYQLAADKKSVSFDKVFVEANVLTFTNVQLISSEQGIQTVKAYLTDFVGLENDSVTSTEVTLDTEAPEIKGIEWNAPAGVAKGSANSNVVSDQTLNVDFDEKTSGVRVIKFDVFYENETESYNNPFENLELTYNGEPLSPLTDYTKKNERYILLNEAKINDSGNFGFKNFKLRDAAREGQYNIKVTLLDQAENKNSQENPADFSKKIFIDTTAPVVSKVKILDAKKRSVYGDLSDTKQWWINDSDGSLSELKFEIKVAESGSGLKIIKLAEDVEFTSATRIRVENSYLTEGVDYNLNTEERTITLFNYEEPKLRGSEQEPSFTFILENVKINKINDADGNKIAFNVEDFVTNPASNQTPAGDYKLYYSDDSDGKLLYADNTKPAIANLKIEDAGQNTETNPDAKSYAKENYTDSQDVTLTIKLVAENESFGSGVETIHLSDNALFTDLTEIKVDGIELTDGFEFAIHKKSVSFSKVFVEANEITFTNVHIINSTDGTQLVKAKLTDFAGLEAEVKTSDNSLILDKVNPVISKVEWIPDDEDVTTAGTTNLAVIDDQTLKVSFAEVTAGVKVIKFDINYENETSTYENPFDFNNLRITYGDNVSLVKETDYTVEGRYIILKNTYKSNSFSFHGIKINNDNSKEGTYTVKVTLQDAAERTGDKSEIISIDSTEPVIDGHIRIPELVQAVELTTQGSEVTNNYWLKKDYVNGTVGATGATAQAPNKIPVYVSVKEKSSGVKVITFSEDVVLTSDTNIYLLATSNPAEETNNTLARTLISKDKYTIGKDNRTITITDKNDSKVLFTKSEADQEVPFILLFENVGFKNVDSTNGNSRNTISVTLSDVAKNSEATSKATTAVASIYSDSLAPAAPKNLTLKDRYSSAATKTIAASTGYTNESIVDMTFSLPASEQFGSGYHQFVLTGATFKNVGENNTANTTNIATNATTVTMLSGTSEIEDLAFDISEDGKTLTLRKYGQSSTEESKAVVRKAVTVTIKNVHLDNAETDGSHSVTLTASDLTGWKSETSSAIITLDTEKPELEKGVFAANYSSSYYKPGINVYPHASGETATGVSIDYGTQSYQKNIPTFYTATTYKTGFYQFNGVVSSVSSTQASSPNTDFIHGAVLGIRGKDNIMLGGYNSNNTFLYYYQYGSSDTLFSKNEKQILAASTTKNPSEDINKKGNKNNKPNGDNSATGSTLWFGFDEGQYSAVIVDEAGNVSEPFHFSVVKDVEKPAKEWDSESSADSADSLNNRVLLQMPDASANVFTNSDVAVANYSDFPLYHAGNMGNYSVRTKKYVTKKTSGNYKIQLNLGGTYSETTPVRKIDNTAASTTTKYKELDATTSSSPIEMYAISTYYGSWPTKELNSTESGASWEYEPVVPYGTTFPSGQTHNDNSYSTTSLAYALGHNYFNYKGGSGKPESNEWKIPNSNVTWHNYKYTGSWATDTGNGIRSQIDSNNNLIIEIPNTQSTAPVSIFLRDGCGNMQYVVCGLYEVSGKQVAISFVLDEKLGAAPTSDGVVTTPFILQFPYSKNVDSSDIIWGGSYYELGAQSGNSEAPSAQLGTGGKLGFIKDKVKHATYYNPDLEPDLNIKHAFALHFYQSGADTSVAENITGKESITFNDADWLETEHAKGIKKASAEDIAAGNYTCRALMYCTNTTDVPTYAEIKECLDAETKRSPNQKTGQVTEWSGVQVSSSAKEAILFVDYPKPDYKKLGWAQSNSQEMDPYYMWYIFEDAVGNYELAKVVNSAVKGSALKAKPSQSSSDFDKWLYDGYGPELKINGTDIEVNKLGTTNLEAQVRKLVAWNNGYVPYLKDSKVFVHADNDMKIRSTSLINSTLGYGTTRWVEDADDDVDYGTTSGKKNREYNPFVDLVVGELTGVRAFAWSTTPYYPSRNSIQSSNNTQGDDSSHWYAGYGKTTTTTYEVATIDIGDSYSNSYYPKTAYKNTTEYSGTYSGTLVNTIIPSQLLGETAEDLYLHVMDWTGNISTYRIGGYNGNSSGLSFVNDKENPSIDNSRITSHEDGKYDVRYKDSSLTVRIANTTEDVKVRFNSISASSPYYSDSDSRYAGFSFVNYDIDTTNNKLKIGNDNNGPYLEIPYETYKNWTTAQDKTVYFYDNVGNITATSVNFIYDPIPPTITKVTLNVASSGGKIADEDGVSTSSKDYSYTANASESLTPASEGFSCKEVYVNADKVVTFAIEHNATNDFDKMVINKWKDSAWTPVKTLSGSTSDSSDDTLKFENGETSNIFQILAYDYCGNVGCQYVKLLLDTAAPTIVTTPVITLGKGSINNIGETYYYTAGTTDKEKLKITFTASDVGVGTKYKYEYSLTGNSNDWHEIPPTSDGSKSVEIYLSSDDKKTLQNIWLKDCLGNPAKYTPGFKYTYGENTEITINTLTYYDCDAPSAPTISTSVLQKKYANGTPYGTAYSVVNEIETRGKGIKNDLTTDNKNASWSKVYTEEISSGTILIKQNRSKVRILLPMTESDSDKKIIGYLKKNDETAPSTTPGAYSFATPSDPTKYGTILSGRIITENNIKLYEIIEDLPLGGDKTPKERYYYAVDVVGNLSPALNLTYTYKNPHQAKNAEIIEDYTTIPESVKERMPDAVINEFAKINPVQLSDYNDKPGIKYFNGGYLIVKCALYKPAGETYAETPVKIELWDKWGDKENERALRGESDPADNTDFFKVFTSSYNLDIDPNNDDYTTIDNVKYYWCYIAFKPGTVERNTNDQGEITEEIFTVGDFDNNDQYEGSRLYCIIRGQTSESEIMRLDNSTTNEYGWKLDNKGPEIDRAYVNQPDCAPNEHQLYKYKTTGSIKIVRDNQIGENYGTNAYSKDMYIYIPKSKVYDRVTVDNKNYTYCGVAEYKTIETGGESDIDYGWTTLEEEDIKWADTDTKNTSCYKIKLPNIEDIHHKIDVYIRDKLGNESILYSLGNPTAPGETWWLVDDRITKESPEHKIEAVAAWAADEQNKFNITLPVGSIIKSVTAKVDGTAVTEGLTVEFNGYIEGKKTPTLNGTDGWLTVEEEGLTVTLPAIEQKWHAQDVEIIINDDGNDSTAADEVSLKKEGFVPVRTLEPGDIKLKIGDTELTDQYKVDSGTYTITIDAPVTITSVSNDTIGFEGFGWESQSSNVITLNVTQNWEPKEIKVKINNTVSKKVFTVNKKNISASDIAVSSAPYSSDTESYTLTISPKNGAPLDRIETIEPVNATGTIAEGWTVNEEGKIEVTLTPAEQKLTEQVVQLKLKEKDVATDFTVGISTGENSVFTITHRDLTKTDLTVEANLAEGEYNYSLTVNEEGASNLNGLITSIIPTNATIKTTEGSDGITRDNNTVSFTVVPVAAGLKSKTISVKINNSFDLDKTFTIDPRALAKSDLTVTATETNGEYAYTITVNETGSDNLNELITSVTPENATIKTTEGSDGITRNNNQVSFTLVPVAAGLKSKTISVKINNSFDLDETFTIEPRALAKSDLTVTAEAKAGKYEYTITVNEEGSNNLNELITSVTPENATIETAEGSDGITRDNDTVSFTLIPVAAAWDAQTISVKINNSFDLDETFTIASKTFTADNINVDVGTPAGNDYTLTITTTDGAPITKITKIDASEGTIATWTHGENKIETTLTVEAGYTAKSINLIFNKTEDSEGLVVENVVTVQAKEIDKTAITILAEGGGELSYNESTKYDVAFNLQHDESIEIDEVSLSEDYGTLTYNKNDSMNYRIHRKNGLTVFPEDLTITIKLKNGSSFDVKIFLENKPKSTTGTGNTNQDSGSQGSGDTSGDSAGDGTDNNGSRSIFGRRTRSAEMPLNDVVGEAPKTRSISLKNWVTDLFTSDSAAASTKAEKKAKKTAKAAKAEKLVKSQADKVLEKALPETVQPAAELAGVVESVSESAVDALTSNDATEATIVDDTLEPSAAMNIPVYDEPLTEDEVEASDSRALIWTFIALIAAALVTAAAVLYTRRRK